MRRTRQRSPRSERSRIALSVPEMRVTNEEILGDLLYPAPASRVSPRPAKRDR